jgi:hypothetical protein
LGASANYLLSQQITAQNQLENMTGNHTGNQSVGLDLVPPRVLEEETQEEIVGGQQ